MSWQANRFSKEASRKRGRSFRQNKNGLTEHHVPPTSTCPDFSRQFILLKRAGDHEAYHHLFRNVGSFERASELLDGYWGLFGSFSRLFGNCSTLAEALETLRKDWWEREDGAETPN